MKMRLGQVDEAASAVRDYRKLLNELEHFNSMKWFRIHGGADRSVSGVTIDPINIEQSMASGQLARAIHKAVTDYYDAQRRLAEERLMKLGIVID